MKKLSKTEADRLTGYAAELRELRGKVEDEIRQLQEVVFAPLNAAIDAYNEELELARGFVEDLASTMDDYYSDRSEKWQEGDAGEQYSGWMNAYAEIELDEIDRFEADFSAYGEDVFNQSELLEALPVEPE